MKMPEPDAQTLARRDEIVAAMHAFVPGEGVISDETGMAVYESDGLTAYRQLPMIVVLPETVAQVSAIMRYCNENAVKIVPRGAGTSLSGGALPAADAITLGLGKFNRVLEVDYENRCAVVQPGVTNLGITHAVEADGFIGSLTTGLVADVAVFDGSEHPSYRAIIEADSAGVALVLRGGEPMYGDATLMDALGANCDAVDVCGDDKSICADQEFDISYDALASSMSSAYPATFCDDVPTDEPTCAPSRTGEFPLDADDADGDGLADADDNCPSVFNPIRPMDDGVQSDHDEDGLGDPCDDSPLLADIDGDTVANADDNCPFDSNTDQADDDNDGMGDECDFCPTASNPDDAICPAETASVYDIQNGTVNEGADVHLEGLVVTGISGVGFAAQHPDGGEYSGLYVYTSSAPGVALGDLVSFDGAVTEYFGETEVVATSWTASGSGSVTAESLTATEASDEAWEGVLVTVSGSVSDAAYDCVVDGENCADSELWEIDSAVLAYDKYYADSDWTANIGTTPVTGVMGYRYDRRRLMPRTSSDF